MRERTENKEMKMKYGDEINVKNRRIRKLRKEKDVEENMN